MGYFYECIYCGNKCELILKSKSNKCPKCEKETLKETIQNSVDILLKKEDLPLSKKFIPIYYKDKLWYYRRSPRNSKKAIMKAITKKIDNKKSWEWT